jgi:hypothetical protein
MTKKKISQLVKTGYAREDDILALSTGLRNAETPASRRIDKRALNMSEGAARTYSMILGTEPIHYWPMDGWEYSPRDVVTQMQSEKGNTTATLKVSSGPFKGSQKTVAFSEGQTDFDTGVTPQLTTSGTLCAAFRLTDLDARLFGNVNSSGDEGFSAFTTSLDGIFTFRVYTTGDQWLVDLTMPVGAVELNTPYVFFWRFGATGHRLYLNGIYRTFSGSTNDLVPSSANFKIFNTGDFVSSDAMNGQLQELAIWDKELTEVEMEAITESILGEEIENISEPV